MGRPKVYTACRDCKRCTNSPIADSGRSFGRKALAVYTIGASELVFAANKKCRMCGHQMSLHQGAAANTAQPVIQIQVQPSDSKPSRDSTKEVSTANQLSIPEMIAQLAQLHDAGMLSDQEFAEKKADLLSRM